MRIPRARTYSGYCRLSLSFAYEILTLSDQPSHAVRLPINNTFRSPQPLMYYYIRFSLFRFRSPLLTESRLISLPPPT